MAYLSFIHVADLNLDSALTVSCPTQDDISKHVAKYVQEAPFEVLDNLIALCEKKRPNFILLSGDIYSIEDVTLKARFALAKFYEKLEALSIAVYYTHARRNPLTAQTKKEIASFKELDTTAYQQNVHIFNDTWECFSYSEDVNIYGISHAKSQGCKNLVELFEKHGQKLNKNCFNIGVLYTSLMGKYSLSSIQGEDLNPSFLSPYLDADFESYDEISDFSDVELSKKLTLENLKAESFVNDKSLSSVFITPELKNASKNQEFTKLSKFKKSEMCAPCTLEELERIGMDYWALGYMHKAQTLREKPSIAYAGSMQGMNIYETGAHGCLFVEIDKQNNTFSSPKTSFYSLAPIEWHEVHVNIHLTQEVLANQNAQDCENEIYHTMSDAMDNKAYAQTMLAIQKNIFQALQQYLQNVWIGQQCKVVLLRIVLHGQSEFATILSEKETQEHIARVLEKIVNTKEPSRHCFWESIPRIAQKMQNVYFHFKDIKSNVRSLFDFESALNRDDILGEVLRVSHNLKNDTKALRSIEKQASDLLSAKITKYTNNLQGNSNAQTLREQKDFMEIIAKAEEICIEVFEPEEK